MNSHLIRVVARTMAHTALAGGLVLVMAGRVSAQSIANAFIRGYEAGMRLQEQRAAIELMNAQRDMLRLFYQQQLQQLAERNRILEFQHRQIEESKQARDSALMARADAETKKVLQAFTLLRPNWQTYEQAMVAYAAKVQPGELDFVAYLDVLYFLARRDEVELERNRVATERTAEVLGEFSRLHPDWKRYEEQMTKIAEGRPPIAGLSDLDYLEFLYRIAAAR